MRWRLRFPKDAASKKKILPTYIPAESWVNGWRESNRLIWIVVGGVVVGWFAITRPLDAACAVAPLAAAWAVDLFARWPTRRAVMAIAVAILMAPDISAFYSIGNVNRGPSLRRTR